MEKLIPLPIALDLKSSNISRSWKNFKQKWKNFELATEMIEASDQKRVATLLSIIGDDAIEIYNTFEWENSGDDEKIEIVMSKFENYFSPKKNIPYERYIFNSRKQKEDESIDEYVTQLRLLADNCEFGAIKDSLVRDRIICGSKNARLRENLLREPDLSLSRAIEMCRLTERAKEQHNEMLRNQFEEINEIKSYQKNNRDNKCKYCNYKHEKDIKKCPARDKTCNNCGKRNHFASVCRYKKVNEVREINDSDKEDEESEDAPEEIFIC